VALQAHGIIAPLGNQSLLNGLGAHLTALSADEVAANTKAAHVIKLLNETRTKRKQERCGMSLKTTVRSFRHRPLKVLVFSQFRSVLNLVGDILLHNLDLDLDLTLLVGDILLRNLDLDLDLDLTLLVGDILLRKYGIECVSEFWGKHRSPELHKFVNSELCFIMLLGKDGAVGLDLSFVTHIFLMDEIWDRSLEQQVVSRAHRMGARGSVIVEQLVMAGTVEEEMSCMATERREDEISMTLDDGIGEAGEEHRSNGAAAQRKDKVDQQKLHTLLKGGSLNPSNPNTYA